MKGAIEEAERIAASDPKYYMPCSSRIPRIRRSLQDDGTGDLGADRREIDVLVSGVGTGGTITGVSRYVKLERRKKIVSVAVEPAESPVITSTSQGKS